MNFSNKIYAIEPVLVQAKLLRLKYFFNRDLPIKQIIMRINMISILLMVALSQVGAESFSQNITLKGKGMRIIQVLNKIEKQTDYVFFYDSEDLKTEPINLNIKDADIEEVLAACFRQSDIKWKIFEKNIVLKTTTSLINEIIPEHTKQQNIQGSVYNNKKDPMPGATIKVKGKQISTQTDNSGSFSIEAVDGDILIITYTGYSQKQVTISGNERIIIEMNPLIAAMEEVVVVGYGKVRKSDLTGSIATVSEADIKANPVLDIGRAMQGRASGVLVTQNSASPGSSATIRIRGTGSINAGNDPLYVVDGFPTDDISSVNPADIESMEILKDASSTAIYGSRGSNGVIIVTTKRGKSGQNIITFESYYGIQSIRRKIPLLNSKQYAEFINEARINGGGEAYFDGSSNERPLPTSLGSGVDWQDEILRDAPIQQYQIMMSGGESKTKYSISGNIYRQNGIILNSDFNRYSLRANFDREISKFVDVGLSIAGTVTKSNAARTETDGGSGSGVTNAAINYAPTFTIYNEDGTYYRNQGPLNGGLVDNPVGLANEITNEFNSNRILTNLFASVKLLKDLSFKSSLGIDIRDTKANYYATREIGLGFGSNGMATVTAGNRAEWLNENTLTYEKLFNEIHKLTALVGFTNQGYKIETVQADAMNFNDDFAKYNNLGSGGTLLSPHSSAGEWTLMSYLARINYGFSNRYLVTLTARSDGSSRFGPNKKYGFFPSGAVAWRLINESFMENQLVFSDFKIRASYGLTGNQSIGDYRYLSSISSVRQPFGGANPVLRIGGIPSGISNLDLGWEKNTQTDIGVDFSILNDKLQFTADYYIKITSDLLFNVNIPQTTGYSTSLRNIGKMKNKGLEFGVNSRNISKDSFKWSTSLNISFNKNKVLTLDGRNKVFTGGASGHLVVSNTVLMEVGEPIGNFYGRNVDGIFQNQSEIDASSQPNAKPGDFRYVDINNDNTITDVDRTVIGNGNPDFFGGISNTLSYRNFDLYLFFQGSYGNDILNFGRFDLYNLNGNNNQSADVLNRWTPTNPSKDLPRANSTGGQRILSDFHIENGSYLRLKNISFGYNLPKSFLQTISLKQVKVYVSAQNLWTVTSYKGYDPEISRFGTSSVSQGMDYGGYPAAKTIMFGLNINL